MASVTIRNLSDDVKAKLVARAKLSGESLEALLRRILSAEADKTPARQSNADQLEKILKLAKDIPPPEPGKKDFYDYLDELEERDKPLSSKI